MSVSIITADCVTALRDMPDSSVHCVVTSPPYWGLRDYGNGESGIGLERSAGDHIEALTAVFREARRVLRKDGTLWLNYGDAYSGGGRGGNPGDSEHVKQLRSEGSLSVRGQGRNAAKPKDLLGLPWRVALALQDDGWWLRSDIIWSKPNPMPESVTDRPTRSHEYLFLLTKSARYFYDAAAIAEPTEYPPGTHPDRPKGYFAGKNAECEPAREQAFRAIRETRNARTVWEIPTRPFVGAHFATFPPELVERCIKAGCPIGGTVLDPFGGAGTTGLVADRLQRNAILIELNPEYAAMARRRIEGDAPLFAETA